ncbi:MAG: ferrous iron transport protein B [Bacteroidetes bacterium]|nr:ferrous iron transport protein B [Bacteroidota bacterium]
MAESLIKVALIGNPNTGKTSVFNRLTGLNQKVGNYPGITVEKKTGMAVLDGKTKASILDLPGTYSLNASSMDESVVIELLLNKNDPDFPDVVIVVSDVESLKRNLLLFTQIKDLEIPTILVVNMADQMKRRAISLDVALLEERLNTRVVLVSTRKNTGIDQLKASILDYKSLPTVPCINASVIDPEYFAKLKKAFPKQLLYKLWLVISQDVNFANVNRKEIEDVSFETKNTNELKKLQHKETVFRYQFINGVLKETYSVDVNSAKDLRSRLDRILMHKVWGYVIFLFILLTIFQAIFDWSSVPMDFIDQLFASFSNLVKTSLAPGDFTNLIAEGIIPGLGGILIFIPQIAFLFFFIAILEESGYMSRVVFLMDRIMRRYGLSGKSVVPLISGTACAIPAILATRNIENWRERLITILVTPFVTCSARLPVYLIIISLVIPDERFLGMSYQGLALLVLYLLGFFMAIFSARLLNSFLKISSKTYFVIEMPGYKMPLWQNVGLTVVEKTKTFVTEAGKIILSISIILWVLASYGPGDNFSNAEANIKASVEAMQLSEAEIDQLISTEKLENSYIGILGKTIEPALKPLGYDWKIGIAIISSFAAREVFVGTLATIYSVGNEDEVDTIKNRMKMEVFPKSNMPVYNLASGISLLLFYAFAMQCMSTLAVVKKETNGWKWPMIQLSVMSTFAYVVALVAFQLIK